MYKHLEGTKLMKDKRFRKTFEKHCKSKETIWGVPQADFDRKTVTKINGPETKMGLIKFTCQD